MVERNWAGNVEYRAAEVLQPSTVDQLRDIVVGADQVHVLGTRHSFNHIADAATLVSLEAIQGEIVVDSFAGTVELDPTTTYGQLATHLHGSGLALHNLASLPHISVGGAVATGTHGSGDELGNLATAVRGLDLLRSDGDVVRLRRGDPDFAGAVIGLGALGAVLRVQLDVEPAYAMGQRVYLDLAWSTLADHFDAITSSGDSVSLFTTWGSAVDQVWVKQRIGRSATSMNSLDDLFGARPATEEQHPILGVSPEHCSAQLGVPGRWSDRLPHFKMGFTPSSGEEIQSELHLPRAAALESIEIIRSLGVDMAPHLIVSEIRTVEADQLWMSSQFARDTVGFHFTWQPHPEPVADLVSAMEVALAHLDPRPHWGKLFTLDAATIATRFPRHHDFVRLVERFDTRGAFRTDWLTRHILG